MMDGRDMGTEQDQTAESDTAVPDSCKKHLLIYAHYYELASTGQLVRELAEGLLPQLKVTVICVVPSYLGTVEEKYKVRKYYFENISGVNLIRVSVPEFSKADKISRIKNIVTYFFRAMKVTGKVKNVDYVMSISQPPILGGMLGTYGKRKCHAKSNIYWLQDANPEQIRAVGYFRCKPLLWMLEKLDTHSCENADLVVVPGRDMVETVKHRFEKKLGRMPKVTVINNWIDEKEIYPLEENHPKVQAFRRMYGLDGKYIIGYSGNLGQYYDLNNLLKVIRKFKDAKTEDGRELVFAFIGNGAQRINMENYVREKHMGNVVFIPYQNKEDLVYSLNAVDVHWCVNAKGIKGVSCPSKYYGIAAVGKPVLGVLGKGTEIQCVIKESGSGLYCEPGDYEGIEKNIKWFIENTCSCKAREMGLRGRTYLEENLSKEKSIRKFKKEIKEFGLAGGLCNDFM